MVFQLTFHADHLRLPLSYHPIVQGFVYHLLSSVPEYSGFIHDKGYEYDKMRHYKMFCFSELTGESRIYGKQIEFLDSVSFSLRTADPICGEILQHALVPSKEYQLCGQTIRLKRVDSSELFLRKDCTKIKIEMISPITVYKTDMLGKRRYYNPLDDEFSELLNRNYRHKWESAMGTPPPDNIEVYALSVGSKDKIVTSVKHNYVTAWKGTYLLKGTSKAFKFLYYAGLGSKNSMGFGMFKIVG